MEANEVTDAIKTIMRITGEVKPMLIVTDKKHMVRIGSYQDIKIGGMPDPNVVKLSFGASFHWPVESIAAVGCLTKSESIELSRLMVKSMSNLDQT